MDPPHSNNSKSLPHAGARDSSVVVGGADDAATTTTTHITTTFEIESSSSPSSSSAVIISKTTPTRRSAATAASKREQQHLTIASSNGGVPRTYFDIHNDDGDVDGDSNSINNNNRPLMMEMDPRAMEQHSATTGASGGDLTSAVLGIIKAMVGPAILYLPHGFVAAGYLAALPIMMISTMMYLHSSKCLLDVWKWETRQQSLVPSFCGGGTAAGGAGVAAATMMKHQLVPQEEIMNNNNDNLSSSSLLSTASTSCCSSNHDHDDEIIMDRHSIITTNNGDNTNVENGTEIDSLSLPPPPPQSSPSSSLSYPDLAYRAFGRRGETLVKVGIALMQSGVCLTYLIFVPHNLQTCTQAIFSIDVSANFFLVLMVLVQIPLSWIRDIRTFTTTNAIANALILYGLMVCLWFALEESTTTSLLQPDDNELYGSTTTTKTAASSIATRRRYAESIASSSSSSGTTTTTSALDNLWDHLTQLSPWGDHWILFIGTSVLLFEGSITLLLPLQEAVRPSSSVSSSSSSPSSAVNNNMMMISDDDDDPRERFSIVYPQVILAIQVFYFVFATTCWMSFGDDVHTVLTTSLPPSLLATTVQLAYSVAVLFTFPLQHYPALEIACHSIAKHCCCRNNDNDNNPIRRRLPLQMPAAAAFVVVIINTTSQQQQRNVIAAGLVCFLGIVARTTMESLDKVVSLTGALIGIPIAFIIPPLIHSQLMPHHLISTRRRQQNYAVAVLGTIAMVLASATTIYQWND